MCLMHGPVPICTVGQIFILLGMLLPKMLPTDGFLAAGFTGHFWGLFKSWSESLQNLSHADAMAKFETPELSEPTFAARMIAAGWPRWR